MVKDNDLPILPADEILLSFFENSCEHIILLDLDYSIQYINHTVPDFSPEQVIGKSVIDLTSADCHQVTLDCFSRVKKTGKCDKYETKYISNNQQTSYFEVRITPLVDNKGTLSGYLSCSRDITEQKIITNSLHKSEKRFRQLAENINQVFWIGSPDWNQVFYVSPAYEKLWGFNREVLYANPRKWIEFIHPDDQAQVIADIPQNPDEICDVINFRDYRLQKNNGEIIWIDAKAYPVKDFEGKTVGITGLAEDITERKYAEYELHKSDKRFRSYFELGLIGMATTSLEKGWIDVNDTLCDLLGYHREEFSKLTWEEMTHPQDIDADVEQFNRVLNKEIDGYSMEKRFIHRNGSIVYTHISISVVRKIDGAVDYFVAYILDISNLKLAEAALLENEKDYIRIQEQAHFGSWNLDLVQNKLVWSDENYRIFGMPAERPKNTYERFLEIVHPDDVAYVNKKWMAAVNDNAPYDIEHRLLIDGQVKWVREVAKVVHNEKGEAIKGIGVTQDITERKLIEEELLKARKLESVGILAGGIAHDFNNILTGLFGNVELAKMKLSPEHSAYNNLQTAEVAMERATSLTSQLLIFAKGGEPLMETLKLKRLIKDSAKLALSGSNVKIDWSIADDLWLVKADKGQLSQVIANLIINADQAMPTGGVLTIEAVNISNFEITSHLGLPEKCIKLSISDSGIGISEEHLDKIFDPYFSTKQSGHGLGLATVHSIISKHNGIILVDSKLDIGTTFSLYLPADTSSSEEIKEISVSDKKDSEPETIAANILVMDDNDMILNLATEILETTGCNVETAIDGNECIEKYTAATKSGTPFDIVIMDLTIPGGMGGKEAVQELLALDPDAKVIVSSGYSSDPIMANYTKYGFKGILKKPYQLKSLEKELFRLLR